MNIAYIFLILIAIAGVISGFCLIYTTLRYKEQFKNYKKELMSDIIMTIIPTIFLIIIIYMSTH